MNLILETERLLLRPFEKSDAEALFAMDSNPNVHKYLWQKPTQNIEESTRIIEYIQQQYKENKIGRFATILKETGEFIGWTGIKFINDHIENGNTNFYDYGYRLNEKFWNKGYASEATKAWLDYGFNQMDLKEINAYTHDDNGASNRVLEKCGMTFIEKYKDEESEATWRWWQMVKEPSKKFNV
jgi:[ribosomal protein S5]-alanine N-acetyltransferase